MRPALFDRHAKTVASERHWSLRRSRGRSTDQADSVVGVLLAVVMESVLV
jgi:hypothetical protein